LIFLLVTFYRMYFIYFSGLLTVLFRAELPPIHNILNALGVQSNGLRLHHAGSYGLLTNAERTREEIILMLIF
jgi:hypothetical protein